MKSSNFDANDDPLKSRRSQATESEAPTVKFAARGLSDERLAALKEFLKHARSEEIVAIRRLYGDNPEVLKAIGLELPDNGR